MIGPDSRVRLAAKVRLRFDERSGKHILLYPERGLELSESAARIAAACREEVIASEIVEALSASSTGTARAQIEADVFAFLNALADRGLLLVSEAAR